MKQFTKWLFNYDGDDEVKQISLFNWAGFTWLPHKIMNKNAGKIRLGKRALYYGFEYRRNDTA